jgi:DNA-binding HxlR family transcriptional regulator
VRTIHTLDAAMTLALTQKGWALPVLAMLAEGVAPRAYTLSRALGGASRAAITDGILHLVELGLVQMNTGHGHPLRPDFWLLPAGEQIAVSAHQIWETAQRLEATDFVRRRWSLPLLQGLAQPAGFSALAERLAPITDRALSLSLKQAVAGGFARRDVLADRFPPATLYRQLGKGRLLCAGLAG